MERGMDWLLQMDPDELLYPQSEAFDITVGALTHPKPYILYPDQLL